METLTILLLAERLLAIAALEVPLYGGVLHPEVFFMLARCSWLFNLEAAATLPWMGFFFKFCSECFRISHQDLLLCLKSCVFVLGQVSATGTCAG